MTRAGLLALVALVGCGGGYSPTGSFTPQSPAPVSGETAGITAAAAVADSAIEAGKDRSQTCLGWGVDIAGGVTRWRECTSATECNANKRQAPSNEVEGLKVVGRAHPTAEDGTARDETDVVRIKLRPGFHLPKGGYTTPPAGPPTFQQTPR